MMFTKEERAMLEKNLTAINDYISTEIIPYLEGSRISFSLELKNPESPDDKREFRIQVSKSGVTGRIGYLGLTLLPDKENPSGASFCSYPVAGLTLLENWRGVKKILQEHIEYLSSTKTRLHTFEV